MKTIRIGFNICICLLVIACSNSPVPINYGSDNCEYCLMIITDSKYGSELITEKGKIFKFDSIECLAAYYQSVDKNDIHSLYVTDFQNAAKLININDAYFLKSKNLRSPMGLNLSAFTSTKDLEHIKSMYSGQIISWSQLNDFVKNQWEL